MSVSGFADGVCAERKHEERQRSDNLELAGREPAMSESATKARPFAPNASKKPRGYALKLFVLAAIASAVSATALARSPYDGAWSVQIMTRSGACDPSSRFGVQIINGRVVGPGGNGAAVGGQVSRAGAVSVSVREQGQWASGSGRLAGSRGSGFWRGQGSRGTCAGSWVAQRTGF
jgi:hypothetical protein